ncbi:MAG: FAD-dependent monooxygenase [Aestuariivita sp.]|nr:FAD-dependent monooxygenase [Aestuariivita sp.]
MNMMTSKDYDIAIVGAGPVGSMCALAHAKKGLTVSLFEANPKAAGRLAGEWLHPPAVKMLRENGINIDALPRSKLGLGFVVFPEDGSEPIVLPYPDGSRGMAVDHAELVGRLNEVVETVPNISVLKPARVKEVKKHQLTYMINGEEKSTSAERIVGADGRASVVRQSLGLSTRSLLCSRMLAVTLPNADLPFEGYGHVVLGGPGPVFIYSLSDKSVRIIVDVPLDRWAPKDRLGFLSESYANLLPGQLGPAFVDSLREGRFHAAVNQLRPRVTYGSDDRVLIGDAAGHYHPMTAVGMTLGFGDALSLASQDDYKQFAKERLKAIRVPEFLAIGLYEVFADHRPEAVVLRYAVYHGWRSDARYREITTRILACEDRTVTGIALAGTGTVARAIGREIPYFFQRNAVRRRAVSVFRALAIRLWWLQRGFLRLRKAVKEYREEDQKTRDTLAKALLHSIPTDTKTSHTARHQEVQSADAEQGLKKAVDQLLRIQHEDGSWEGEMVWCPMLTAQYALLHYIIGEPLNPKRRQNVIQSFRNTKLDHGTWGMHEHAEPNLFVTALVYVAARLLGVEKDDPLLVSARQFIRNENLINIPSWGKFWLSVLNLYDWRGMNAVLPELWALPRWIPLQPSNWYCHTRLIYMAMAATYARRFQTPVNPLILALREELYPQGFENINFSKTRNKLRKGDLYAKPSIWLKCGYSLARLFERFHRPLLRERCTEAIIKQIRWEMKTSNHTNISPVSGILNILALWLVDPDDADSREALTKLEDWIWEDDDQGARVCGARSASWDTGFALQALATLPADIDVQDAVVRGTEFLTAQQIDTSFEGFRDAYRSDPMGGWCFAGQWHGWPVSDCTAEAVLGIIASQGCKANKSILVDAVGFMLRSQNRDGGFGSYESRRSLIGLEWLNPAEMFGDSMTEHSFVECTASCLGALAACRTEFPQIASAVAARAIARAELWLRQKQFSDGSWEGVWGIQYIYGTLFGVRGLVAAGACPSDPALRSACHWLITHQNEDGGWGEHHSGCLSGQYEPHTESQVIQTAWALMTLLEAGDSNWTAITRGTQYLLNTQDDQGRWPKQDMAGVFFKTALLDYVLYRQYFPVHALSLYQRRRKDRMELISIPSEMAD